MITQSCYWTPKDYTRLTEFRKLFIVLRGYGVAGAMSLTHHIFHALFQELSYYAERNPLGCIPKADFKDFFDTLEQADVTNQQLVDALLFSKLLIQDGESYMCLVFFENNEHLSRWYNTTVGKSQDILAYRQRKKRFDQRSNVLMKTIAPERYLEVDGKRIDETEMRHITGVVQMLDSILGRPERDDEDFSAGIVMDAARALRKTGIKNMEIVLVRLLGRRSSPGIPRTAEKFLARFDDSLRLIEPDNGWGEWSLILRKTQEVDTL